MGDAPGRVRPAGRGWLRGVDLDPGAAGAALDAAGPGLEIGRGLVVGLGVANEIEIEIETEI